MRIDLRNLNQQRLFRIQVDRAHPPRKVKPPQGQGPEVFLNWDETFDDHEHLRTCPICGCKEFFTRKDFPQVTGFVIVALAAIVSMVLFGFRQVLAALIVLLTLMLVDALIFFFTGRCLVCYRCRSEFRDLPIPKNHPGWNLATGEKYRQGEKKG